MKVVKATGLVPVEALVDFDIRVKGEVFGVLPPTAGRLIARKAVKLAKAGEGVEMEDVDLEEAKAATDPVTPVGTAPPEAREKQAKLPSTPADTTLRPKPEGQDIPDGWRELPAAKRHELARKIAPKADFTTDLQVTAVIEAEIARRKELPTK